MKNTIRFLSIMLILIAGAAASASAVKIETIKDNPERYDGRTVRIRAVIDRTIRIPLTDYAIYVLNDAGHRLALLSKGIYHTGKKIRVRALVVAYSDSYDEKKSADDASRLSNELVEHLGADKGRAEGFAKAVIKVVSTVSDAIEGVYLLIEGD